MPYCPVLPPGLDMQFFDNAVNEGPHTSVVLLQRALKVDDDGVFGAKTLAAIPVNTAYIQAAVHSYGTARSTYYRSLRNFKYFGTDWLRRASEITTASLGMVKVEV
jgi:lysozyme family protein